ncbi:MAG: winged helix-turn-helix transcriptional regulator [Synechococcales cyanobacterium RU_4_20]|nr:winged helix-turn-helix transcriptional regulator [Synechococcales cyanobacterium RU_4_20]NJR67634.1 winged helix-turn-helix transcriptional regulator [Synechococcales cyanobacterium CRU_2_2]
MTRAVGIYDSIDRILDGWAQSHPQLDFSAKDVTLRLRRLTALMEARSAPTLEQLGLKPEIFTLMAELHRRGHPYDSTPRYLMSYLEMSSGGMSNLLDRAETSDFIRRVPDPLDGRSVVVQLTPLGQERIEAALKAETQQEQALLTPLSRRERETLAQLLRKLICAAVA